MGIFTTNRTTTSTLNEAITNAVVSVMKACSASASNSTDVNIQGGTGDVYIGGGPVSQTAVSTINCQQQSQVTAALKSEIVNAIQAKATSSSNSWFEMPDIGSSSITVTRTANRDVTNWDVTDIHKCFSDTSNNVQFNVIDRNGNIIIDKSVDQTATANVAACVQKSTSIFDKTTSMANDIKAQSASQNVLESMFAQMGSIAAAVMSIVLLIVIIMVIGSIIMLMLRRRSNTSYPTTPKIEQPYFGDGSSSLTSVINKMNLAKN